MRRLRADDSGNAVLEFVVVAVVVLVPLVYLIAAVATVQRSRLAVSTAAREAGRAFATSERADQAVVRARAAIEIALRDQGIAADSVDVKYVAAGASCDAAAIAPQLTPGAEFTVCVSRSVDLPAIPHVLTGRGIRTVGIYVVHVDEYRSVP